MTRLSLISSTVLALSVAAASALGCSGSTAANDPTAAATAAQTAPSTSPVAPQVKGHLRLVADALSQVPLRADQRAEIEQMAKDAQARHTATASAHAAVMQALAAQIEAGKIDRAALQPQVDAAVNAATAAQPADRAAFQRLHDLLTPEQRAQFADAIQAQVHARMGEHEGHADPHGKGGMLAKWAADLKLTDDQQAQIKAALHDQFEHDGEHHGMHDLHQAHMKGKEMLDAFKADNFTLPPAEDIHAHASAMADHFTKVAAAVLPILTPEQRTLAAQKLREKAASGEDLHPMGE